MIFNSIRITDFRSIADSGDLPLGPITLIIGRNNAGKSSLLRALYLLQDGSEIRKTDIRVGFSSARILLSSIADIPLQNVSPAGIKDNVTENQIQVTTRGKGVELYGNRDGAGYYLQRSRGVAPGNLIYPVFSGRAQRSNGSQVDVASAHAVWPHDANIVARVAMLATAQFPEALQFRQLCRDVLGFDINVIPGEHGQYLGIQVDRFSSINIDAMGTGVASVLNLIVSLCGAKGKLFLIEEPENDLHPHALKALLAAVLKASEFNQFVITTHSSIVLTRLGSPESTVVLHASADGGIPPSTSYEVVSTSAERVDVLQELGYEVSDLYLSDGWMIFEESSAERLVRQYLIPWFAPGLRGMRTVAAGGTSRVEPLVIDFVEMLLFSHLEPMYRHRAWVVVDGDTSGQKVVSQLERKFSNWPSSRFSFWSNSKFEDYYPSRFQKRVAEVFIEQDKARLRAEKKRLLDDLLDWIAEDEEVARAEFEAAAHEVISYLRSVEEEVIGMGRPRSASASD
ncbi:ATP-dependent endonuclease [Streptomyces sp. FIT100]|uniref:ATP-dependent nuclease n=1 Tax=Streptomyces sp. FIT100 TaxID=2837956 RepID=UPI0021C921B0|nr:AAA family ATPase [Streptomyces sp. FIT100]UUN27798.1 AAA family ATPase [Streptomyces sp. FIT100]